MYIVAVEFTVKAGQVAAFMPLMVANAQTSRERESDCRQFDVCADPARPEMVFLYEVYDDRAAFDAHLASEHFKEFDRNVAPMLAGKAVRSYARVDPVNRS